MIIFAIAVVLVTGVAYIVALATEPAREEKRIAKAYGITTAEVRTMAAARRVTVRVGRLTATWR